MRKPIIAGNWKMHGTRASVAELLAALKQGVTSASNDHAEMIVFPPAIFIPQTEQALTGSPIHWGGQNTATEIGGAFTGEISAAMLLEFKCQYVLIGHSERRALYGETDAITVKKFNLAQQAGLQPILCLGETLEERQAGHTRHVVLRQLDAVLKQISDIQQLSHMILAYEPVWAIGTGLNATPEQAQEVHELLREQVAKYAPSIAEKMRILYGGSVKAANANSLFAMPDIDGGLVGGASLNAQEFLQIYHSIN